MFGAAAGREKYAKPGTAAYYQKERDEYRAKYQREQRMRKTIEAKHEELKSRVDAIERDRTTAERYQRAGEAQADGIIMDIEEEMSECRDMTPDQFKQREKLWHSRYQRVPIGRSLPVPKAEYVKGKGEDERADKYSKRAVEIADAFTADGKYIPFHAAMEQAKKEIDAKEPQKTIAGGA
jgi:hypothetical protein